jgi:hypothetical protein
LIVLAHGAVCAWASSPDGASTHRFLRSERDQGGILYTATAGALRGRQLPLSFLDSAAYWGEHVCSGEACAVVDGYDPHTHALTPDSSPAGDLQTERVNAHNGINIYDGATWQIALMLGATDSDLPPLPDQDLYALVSNQNLLLHEGYTGNSRHPVPTETRGVTNGAVFVYNGHRITDPAQAFAYRMLPRTWLATDPLAATPYARFIRTRNLPPENPEYQAGTISWTDWKPITGENAWAFLIGPLQAARLQYQSIEQRACIPFRDLAVQNALSVLPAFAALQSPLGAVYAAPSGTLANQGTQLLDPSFASVENTISLYAGLNILRTTLNDIRSHERTLTPDDHRRLDEALHCIAVMIDGGDLDANRRTDGLLAFLRNYAWQEGHFVQGGRVKSPDGAHPWQPNRETRAVDVNTWGITALGPQRIDHWFGLGASFRTWQEVKRWGGYGEGTTLWGVGFSDRDGNGVDPQGRYRQGVLSVEWTAGAITMVRAMIGHYQTIGRQAPANQEAQSMVAALQVDERSMLAAMERLRLDTYPNTPFPGQPHNFATLFPLPTTPYLYASRRYLIPFGWYANPIPSTCATAWMVMVANGYNPFVPGGSMP